MAFLWSSNIRTLRRLAALQMPRTALGLRVFVGTEPSFVSIAIGIWIAIVWMFSAFVPSTPVADSGGGIR